MLEVRFEVEDPENWVKSESADSTKIRIMDIKNSEGLTHDLVEVSSEQMRPEELVAHLRTATGVVESDLTRVDKDRVMGTITTHDCPVCSAFSNLDCFLISASTTVHGMMEWRLLVSGDEHLKGLCERLDANGVKYRILEINKRIRKKEITARQEEILRIALDLGFFEFPKRITLEGLAGRLKVSQGTLSEILRRAEKNVLSGYFGTEKAQQERSSPWE